MDFFQSKKKKKLDFETSSFVEQTDQEFKVPCREVTNNIHNDTKTRSFAVSCFGDDENSSRDSEVSSCSEISVGKQDTVNVYLRLKPVDYIPDSYSFDQENVILKGSQTAIDRTYTFTSILKHSTDQSTVYDTCVRPVLSNPFTEAGAVFASYGVSNSGKTYTILGEESAGIVPRALTQLFIENKNHVASFPCVKVVNEEIKILNDGEVGSEMTAKLDFLRESRKGKSKKDSWISKIISEHNFEPKPESDHSQIFIWISFVEIYNEKIIDLFKIEKSQNLATAARPLKVICNNRKAYVHGLTWLHVNKLEEAIELLQAGVRKVNYAATGMNKHSSRSHTIFTICVIKEFESTYEFSSYKFCDLAGAERNRKTQAAGDRLKEAGGINTSLMVLGKCLEAVLHNQKIQKQKNHKKEMVPVRESKLTFLLQSSLMGREKFVMIVNLLPTMECYDENVNVLHFGSIANEITIRKAKVKKYSRPSSRYTYFMTACVNSPKMNSSLVLEESIEVYEASSVLSPSYMSSEELRKALYAKDVEIGVLRDAIRNSEKEKILLRSEIMKEFQERVEKNRESDKRFFEENNERLENYYEKKLESLRLKYERKIADCNTEIDGLYSENRKLKKRLGLKDDLDIIDVDDDETESEDDEEASIGDDEIENVNPENENESADEDCD